MAKKSRLWLARELLTRPLEPRLSVIRTTLQPFAICPIPFNCYLDEGEPDRSNHEITELTAYFARMFPDALLLTQWEHWNLLRAASFSWYATAMKFFITGGAGFLGINEVRHLLARGHKVVSYDLVPFDYPEKDRVTAITGDIRDFNTLKEAMRGCDIVIHTAAALPLYMAEDIRTTDIDGVKNVLRAAKENGVQRMIHISSTAVYGIPDHHPLYESDKLDGVGEYGKAKIAAEQACEAYRAQGMIVPVIRPKSFIGPERLGVFALFYDWARTGHNFPMIGSGNNRYQLLGVEDLCDAIYLCATLPAEKANDTFNIGAKDFTTMKEDYQAVLDRAGFGKHIVGLPAVPAIWMLRVLELLRLSPLYKWVYETASKDSFVSIEKAEAKLGYAPKYSNKQALVRNYEWYIANLASFQGESGVSHRVPWKQGILALAKLVF